MKFPYNHAECETILQWRCEKSNASQIVKMHHLIYYHENIPHSTLNTNMFY